MAMSSGPPPLHPNAQLNVLDVGNMTFISGEIRVGKLGFFDGDLRDNVVKESNLMFGNSVTELDGRMTIMNITFSAVGKGEGNILVGRMTMEDFKYFRDVRCRTPGAWTPRGQNQILFAPKSLSLIHEAMFGTNTGAHEMGHFFGLTHLPKPTGALMSYGIGPWRASYGRSFSAVEANVLADRHRGGW